MADENLQYVVTFKTRKEGNGAEQTAAGVRDLRSETDRLNALNTAEKAQVAEHAFYDLDAAIAKKTITTRRETAAVADNDLQRAKAMQTVRKIREELALSERMQQRVAVASTKAAGSYKSLGGSAAMAAFQVQDAAIQLQAGVKVSTVLAQQLPQLLMIFGPGGAIAGGVIALGALAYSWATATKGSEEAEKAQQAYNEKLKELIALKAEQFVDAYRLSVESTEAKIRSLNDAEVEQLGTKAAIEAANRRIQNSQDDLTKAWLRYQQTVTGVDMSAQLQQLEQAGVQRQADEAIAAQNLKLEQQRAAYENIREELARLKQDAADWDQLRQGMETKVSGLFADLRLAQAQGKDTVDIKKAIEQTEGMIAELRAQSAGVPRRIADLGRQAADIGQAIDRTLQETEANIAAINAETAAKVSGGELDAALQQNRSLVSSLTSTLEDFKATTPAQQQAAEAIRAAVADGVLTAQELQQMGANLQNLMGGISSSGQTMNNNLLKLIQLLADLQARQSGAEKKIQALMNRQ